MTKPSRGKTETIKDGAERSAFRFLSSSSRGLRTSLGGRRARGQHEQARALKHLREAEEELKKLRDENKLLKRLVDN